MSLAGDVSRRVPTGRRSLDGVRIHVTSWICCLVFLAAFAAMLLLDRLGMPVGTATGLMIALLAGFVLFLSWQGRTMTGATFFYSGRVPGAAAVGVSSVSDWTGGAVLAAMLALSVQDRLALAFAIPVAIVIHGVAIAPVMQRSGVVTVPGLLAWRTGTQRTGLLALIVLLPVLGLLAFAEARIVVLILTHLSGFGTGTIAIAVLALAVVPALGGGWLAVGTVNLVLAVCAMSGLLLPSLALAFVSPDLLPPLAVDAVSLLPVIANSTLGVSPILAGIVLTAGFAALPIALSRAALTIHPTAAMQASSWMALVVFLVMTALPLSLLLLVDGAGSERLGARPLLAMLPALALLLLAFNSLSACLFVAATSVVRALRRTQRKDPSERSMASIRMLVLAFALFCGSAVKLSPSVELADNVPPLLLALSLAAGGLFAPLMAVGWVSRLSWVAYSAAIVSGALAVGISAGLGGSSSVSILHGGAIGLVVSIVCIMAGRMVPTLTGRTPLDPRLAILRTPDGA